MVNWGGGFCSPPMIGKSGDKPPQPNQNLNLAVLRVPLLRIEGPKGWVCKIFGKMCFYSENSNIVSTYLVLSQKRRPFQRRFRKFWVFLSTPYNRPEFSFVIRGLLFLPCAALCPSCLVSFWPNRYSISINPF